MLPRQFNELKVGSGDASLFVRMIGGYDSGPALIALHGGPGISHEYMLGLARLASPDLRVVFYDQRQVGRSTGIAASSDPLQEWANDLEAVRQAVKTEQVHLLGHSAGGFPAIAYGNLYRERTQSILFIDSVSPIASLQSQAMERLWKRIAELKATGRIPAYPPPTPEDGTALIAAAVPVVHFVKPQDPAVLHGATYRPVAGDQIMQALGNYDLRAQVSRLTMSTLCYISAVPFGREMAGSLYDALPKEKAQRLTIPNCGHMPWIECPDEFFPKVEAFLKSIVVEKASER